MKCSVFRNQIDKYTEGILGEEEKHSFDAHLLTCAECRELVAMQELTNKIIASEKKVEPDFFLSSKIMSRIEDLELKSQAPLIRVLKPALAAISIAAAITGGILIGNISEVTKDNGTPMELTLMNDAEMEQVNLLTVE
jgi:predicted anti-sigma-YlaC factor YlaD